MAPRKLTKELQQKLCEYLEGGNFRVTAAHMCGINENTFGRWYQRGAEEEVGDYHDFYTAVNEAEAKFLANGAEQLKNHAVRHPKLLMWLMSRRAPHLYGRRDNVEEKTSEDKAAQEASTRQLVIERLERLLPAPPKGEPDAS